MKDKEKATARKEWKNFIKVLFNEKRTILVFYPIQHKSNQVMIFLR